MANNHEIIERFEAAVREHEMRGAQHPADQESIQQEYDTTKRVLIRTLERRENMYDRIAAATGVAREDVKKVAHALSYI